jgi:hypothetical protein
VVAHRGGATYWLDTHGNTIAHLQGRRNADRMHSECANWALCVAHLSEELPARVKDLPRIANLSAALGIERGATNDQLPLVACRQRSEFGAVTKEPNDSALSFELFVTDELRLAHTPQDLFIERGGHGDLRKGGLLAAAAAFALFSKGALKTGTVNGDAALSGEFNGEIDWEAVGVVQLEGDLATERWACGWQIVGATTNDALPCAKFGKRIAEQARTGIKRSCELRLFALNPFKDCCLTIS